MLGKLGAALGDGLGTGQGDNCYVYYGSRVNSETVALSYLVPGETPFCILSSKLEDFVFTDYAFISIKGHSTIGTKRIVNRYDFADNQITAVSLNTPGLAMTDLDGNLLLGIGGVVHEIDIRKDTWETVKPLYKALLLLKRAQHQNMAAVSMIQGLKVTPQFNDASKLDALIGLTDAAIQKYHPASYKYVWESADLPKH